MSLVQLKSFNAYWAKHPPVHIMIASYLGVKSQDSSPPSEQENSDLEAFIQESMKINGVAVEPDTF